MSEANRSGDHNEKPSPEQQGQADEREARIAGLRDRGNLYGLWTYDIPEMRNKENFTDFQEHATPLLAGIIEKYGNGGCSILDGYKQRESGRYFQTILQPEHDTIMLSGGCTTGSNLFDYEYRLFVPLDANEDPQLHLSPEANSIIFEKFKTTRKPEEVPLYLACIWLEQEAAFEITRILTATGQLPL